MANGKIITVLGRGHLAQEIPHRADPSYEFHLVGRNDNPRPAIETSDAVISTIPGVDLSDEMLALLRRSRRPVILASTGRAWPKNLHRRLQERGLVWIYSPNFAHDMHPIRHRLLDLGQTFRENALTPKLYLSETHDIKKKDVSATALMWEKCLGRPVTKMRSLRESGALPFHVLRIVYEDGHEEIVTHRVQDRKIYVDGMLWALAQITAGHVSPGLIRNETLWDSLQIK